MSAPLRNVAEEEVHGMDYETVMAALEDEDAELLGELLMADVFETQDGCQVEPDGTCPHGYKSPLLIAGLI